MEKLEKSVSEYEGVGRIFRLQQIANQQKAPGNANIYVQCLNLCKTYNYPGLYKSLIEEAIELKIEIPTTYQKAAWVDEAQKKISLETKTKDTQIQKFQSQNNKLETRQALIELAKIYLHYGDLREANRNFEKACSYNLPEQTLLDFSNEWIVSALFEKKFDTVKNICPKEPMPEIKDLKPSYIQCQIINSLKCIIERDFTGFLSTYRHGFADVDYFPKLDKFCKLPDIGAFIGILALNCLKRQDINALMQVETTRALVSLNDTAHEMIQAYLELDYQSCSKKLAILMDIYEFDPYLSAHKETVHNSILDRLIKQFLTPYKKIKIEKVAENLNLNIETINQVLKGMVENKQINFIIDQLENCLILRSNENSKKVKIYKRAVNVISKYLDDKQLGILRYQLANIQQHEQSKIKMKMGDFAGGIGNEELLNAMISR